VRWYETTPRGFMLRMTPLSVAESFQEQCRAQRRAWIFTSATLAVGDDFGHFCGQLGLPQDTRALRWDSPFDFARAALLYLPPNLPDPSSPRHTEAVVQAAIPLLRASRGRAFLLFTSHRALQAAAALLPQANLPYPLLVQGGASTRELLQQFRRLGNAILLGTASFWEGVDVRGEALSCVIIDKLPFASPGDPVLEARLQYLRDQGGNPFTQYQVPQAVITLKQGAGRLIRDEADRGVLALCDPRILSKPYGRVFLDSLPPMRRTRVLRDVERFWEE
jgi:ATP-dependent DNA helicase DinG